jgi:hypothetical protein
LKTRNEDLDEDLALALPCDLVPRRERVVGEKQITQLE